MPKNINGISVALPFVYSHEDGPYRLNKTLLQTVRQNLKNLILTSPGERIMIPTFGVGLRRFLFEGMSGDVYEKLGFKIREQVNKYMPFVTIEKIEFHTIENNPDLALNEVNVQLVYNLGQVAPTDVLSISQILN
jgi:phage baseplate assembly protein W